MPKPAKRQLALPPTPLVIALGSLLWHRNASRRGRDETTIPALSSLSVARQEAYWLRAAELLEMLDQLEMAVVPKASLPKAEDRQRQLQQMTATIQAFVNLLGSFRPEHFPAEELAHRLME